MPISSSVPYHLIAGARAGFLQAFETATPMWQRVAQRVDLGTKSTDLVDLGAAPMPKNSKSGVTMQDFVEKRIAVTPQDWDITVHISKNAVKDDTTGTLDQRVRSAGERFNQHFDKLCFGALNSGEAATYGLCYDGLYFFSDSHVDKQASYTTVQDNKFAATLTLTNFNTVWTAAMNFKDDQGEPARYNYDLLVVPPALALAAAQITDNAEDATTGNRAMNPFNGKIGYVVSQDLDATSWFLVASSHVIKPVLLVMREAPHLDETWVEPERPDGGWYMMKFAARYNVFFGDWRLAVEGNS